MSGIEYVAGGYVYAVRAATERGSLEIHHPDEEALRAQGFRPAWSDHTADGGFYVYRRPLAPGAPRGGKG